jgi:hypothetical protein
MHGQEDVIVAEFLDACDVDIVQFNGLDEKRVMWWQVDICADVPNENVDSFHFAGDDVGAWAPSSGTMFTEYHSAIAVPCENVFFQ